ncbi:MAG: rane protein [Pseudonocardiales bacterium]|nr:rane protein [Pseudonocardiales bacterium]
MSETPVIETAPVSNRRDARALLRYRVMAYTTGVMLLLCCVVALPLEYGFGVSWVWVLWMLHGYLFIVYVITALHLGLIRRWNLPKLGLIAVAGTIPLLVFFMERRIVSEDVA